MGGASNQGPGDEIMAAAVQAPIPDFMSRGARPSGDRAEQLKTIIANLAAHHKIIRKQVLNAPAAPAATAHQRADPAQPPAVRNAANDQAQLVTSLRAPHENIQPDPAIKPGTRIPVVADYRATSSTPEIAALAERIARVEAYEKHFAETKDRYVRELNRLERRKEDVAANAVEGARMPAPLATAKTAMAVAFPQLARGVTDERRALIEDRERRRSATEISPGAMEGVERSGPGNSSIFTPAVPTNATHDNAIPPTEPAAARRQSNGLIDPSRDPRRRRT